MYRKYASTILWAVSLVVIGSMIGTMTRGSIDSWYTELNISPLSPPNYLFGFVWSILYATLGVAGCLIWQKEHSNEIFYIKTVYLFQLLMNFSWTPIFFYYHAINLALLLLFTIIILVFFLICKFLKNQKFISLLLTPYLLWLIFAFYLNLHIYIYN